MKIGKALVKMGDKVFCNGKPATLEGIYNGLINIRYENGELDRVEFKTLKAASRDELNAFSKKEDVDSMLEVAKQLKKDLVVHGYHLNVTQEVKSKDGK